MSKISGELVDENKLIDVLKKFYYDIDHQRYIQTTEVEEVAFKNKGDVFDVAMTFGLSSKCRTPFFINMLRKKRLFNPLDMESSKLIDGILFENLYQPTKIAIRCFKHRENSHRIESQQWFREFRQNFKEIYTLLLNLCNSNNNLLHFLNWLSFCLMTRRKVPTAFIFKGVQGAGKNFMWDTLIKYFLGDKHTVIMSNEEVSSRFMKDGMNQCLGLLLNEIKSDFREGNTTYEKLKQWVSDTSFKYERKGVDSIDIQNYFFTLIFTNHAIPIQIQTGDRRYNVFKTCPKRLELVAADLGVSMTDYIQGILRTRDDFFLHLSVLDFSESKARSVIETEEKAVIMESSTPKIEVLANYVKSLNRDFFINDLVVLLEEIETETLRDMLLKANVTMIDYQDKKIDIKKDSELDRVLTMEFLFAEISRDIRESQRIKNKYLVFLYRLYINPNENNTKLGNALNAYFGKPKNLTSNYQRDRYRSVESPN